MPDDTEDLNVRLTRNDGAEEFNLKANKVERSMGNNLVTKGILSVAGDLAGKNVNLGFENFTLNGKINNTQEGTYPTGGDYPDLDLDKWARATEKEMALAHATRAWGPDAADGFDRFEWGPRDRGVMINKYSATENRDKTGPEQYAITLELTHANVYIGDD